MRRFARALSLVGILLITGSCSNVAFQSPSGGDGGDGGSGGSATVCTDSACAAGGPGDSGQSYTWAEGGFGLCTKPCGGGNRTQTVQCQRTSDKVVVADSLCSQTKPSSAQTCNVAACTTNYKWNDSAPFGACPVTCGGGTATRNVPCQDNAGNTVADTFCTAQKPATSQPCGTATCTQPIVYNWSVQPGACPVACGGGTATDIVTCKGTDGSVGNAGQCTGQKPASSHPCGTNACTVTYTYTWAPGTWGQCTQSCGNSGVQTRSIACKRNDGIYVAQSLCPQSSLPTNQQSCPNTACPPANTNKTVTQTTTVPAASNTVDVILIVDDSSSMQVDQNRLSSRLIQLVNDLDQQNIDYQICLSTTDIGYYVGSPVKWAGTNSMIFNKNTPNKNQVFIDTINSLGAEWSNDEQGIKQVNEMITGYGPNSGNDSGCFRAQSTLTVIEVSNEDERSVGGNQAESSVQYQPLTPENLPANLIKLVHSTFDTADFVKPFIWNSIIVKPGDSACIAQQDALGTPAFPGVLLAQLANATGGQVASICDTDYANNMTLINSRIVNSMPGLQLQCTPLNNPSVSLNPSFATAISLSGSQLRFSPALPEGEQITATYTCSQ